MSDRVDAHCHLWTLSRGDYGWLDPEEPDLAPILRDFKIGDLRSADPEGDARQRIVVQAAPTVAETRFLLECAAKHEDIAGVVGWVDLSADNAVETLTELAANPWFKGVRPMLQDIADPEWINSAPKPDAIASLVAQDLTFDALVLPQHLEPLLKFALANPDLPIVIDHAAKPALSADASDSRHALWREGMMRLANETSARCKLSGVLTELAPSQCKDAKAVLQPVVDDLLDWFGPDRLMWGSDWPVLTLAASYGDWQDLSANLLTGVDGTALDAIHAGTAREFYGLEAAA